MKASAVYLKAAITLEAAGLSDAGADFGIYRFCCNAISRVSRQGPASLDDADDHGNKYRRDFKRLYGKNDRNSFGWYGIPNSEAQGARVIALLLASEIAKDAEAA